MFTGLVEDVGRVTRVDPLLEGQGRRLSLEGRLFDEELPIGASVAIDGVCLTVTTWSRGQVTAEVGPETMARTTLGALVIGSTVNLERPMKLGDRLGGHLVAGHVDTVGKVAASRARGEAIDVTVAAPAEILRYVVEKGSIAIDGISLTVNRVDERGFDVSIIPHTQSATTLTKKAVGAPVNLEVDLIGKYVEKLLGGFTKTQGVTMQTLKEHGFVDE